MNIKQLRRAMLTKISLTMIEGMEWAEAVAMAAEEADEEFAKQVAIHAIRMARNSCAAIAKETP